VQPVPTPAQPPVPAPAPAAGADAAADPNALPDPSALNVAYFAIKVGGEEGKAVGLFRIADNEEQQVLTLERFTPAGEWEDDPQLIDDLHEPGVYSVDENEAQQIQGDILAAHDPTQDAPPPQGQ
jgi:hypothetical protein